MLFPSPTRLCQRMPRVGNPTNVSACSENPTRSQATQHDAAQQLAERREAEAAAFEKLLEEQKVGLLPADHWLRRRGLAELTAPPPPTSQSLGHRGTTGAAENAGRRGRAHRSRDGEE